MDGSSKMIEDLKDDLIRDEGLRLKPYKDTVGKITIGVGRNLDDVGISPLEANTLLENDINRTLSDLDDNAPWWRSLPEDAQRGIANMCFNMGWPRLSKFRKMLTALEENRFNDAAREALDSKWASQVGNRSERIADLYRGCS